MVAVAIGRVVGLVLDGFDKAVVPPLVLELVIAAILMFAHFKKMVASTNTNPLPNKKSPYLLLSRGFDVH
ncbi:hypothetical protein QW180_22235 [Vibrio sinaloensis]|nr:hypothetical protein [Vibrio sinaloensis]